LLSNFENISDVHTPKPMVFLFGTIIWSWFFYSLIYVSGKAFFESLNPVLGALGGLGPLFVSFILVNNGFWSDGQQTGLNFLKKSLNPLLLELKWFVLVCIFVFGLTFAPFLLEPSMLNINEIFKVGPLSFILIGAIFGGLEEIGWRGYAQETLQKKISILNTSLVIGFFWAIWHLPLFFLEGTYQYGLGVGTPQFWAFNIAILISSPVYAWIYNSVDGVTFSVVLFHALGNVLGELTISPSPNNSLIVDGCFALLLVLVSWRWITKKK